MLPEKIDLNEMPKWLTQPKYEGVETDIKDWYTSYYFWRRWNGKEETIDTQMAQSRAIAEAKYEALKQTNSIKNSSERSSILQAYDIYKNGWYKYVGEIEDVRELLEEMLNDELENKATGSKRYDLEFIIKQLFPALEAMQVPAEYIVAIPDNIAKARALVPAARNILKTIEDPEEAKENLIELIKDVPNPEISLKTYTDKISTFMGKETKHINQVPAEIFILPNKELIVIESDRAHTLAIESKLRGIVTGFDFRDSVTLMKKLNAMLLPKDNDFHKFSIVNGELAQSYNGVLMPSKEKFANMCIQTAVENKYLIEQMLDRNLKPQIMIYIIKSYCEKDLYHELAKLFAVEDPLSVIGAIYRYYQIPSIVTDMFECPVFIDTNQIGSSKDIGITLTFDPDLV